MYKLRGAYILGAIITLSILTGCSKDKDALKEDLTPTNEWIISSDDISDSEDFEVNEVEKEDVSDDDSIVNDEKEEVKKENIDKEDLNKTTENIEEISKNEEIKVDNKKEDSVILLDNPIFTKSEITDSVKARMQGKSMPSDSTIGYDELSYLTITYLDYNGQSKQGEMVVHKDLADEVLDIFEEIYRGKFPIERMKLVDDYNAVDHTSMVNNNSSAFCYRTIAGTNKVSNHGKGMAIDINPFYNPHVLKSKGTVNPPEASKYADRSLDEKGMIKYNDVVYKAFTSRGWKWGGHWNNPDYQHFEKSI